MFSTLISDLLNWVSSFVSINVPTFGVSNSNMNTIGSSISALSDFIGMVNFIVPLSDIAIIIGLDMALRFSKLTLFIINWVIRRIADLIP